METTTRPGIYRVHNADGGIMAYAATVERVPGTPTDNPCFRELHIFFAGSCSGPITGHIERVQVGDRFTHHQFGLVEVAKINRKTIKLDGLGTEGNFYTGERFSLDIG